MQYLCYLNGSLILIFGIVKNDCVFLITYY